MRHAVELPTSPRCSLVIPVYKNEGSLPELMDECASLHRDLNGELEVVFVVDGSPDACFAWLRENLPKQPFASQLSLHSRNFGSFAAIRTGFEVARGQLLAVMAADLQEPICVARAFFEKLNAGTADVAVGFRESREDPPLSRLASTIFWSAYRRWVQPEIPPGGVDVFGCTRQVRDHLLSLEERNSSLVGQLFWVGFRRELVPYARRARKHGTSAWSLGKKIRYLFDSLYAFSDLPIRGLKWLGGVSAMTGLVVGAVVLTAWFLGDITVPGYTPTVLAVTFFGGLNAFGLGLVGEYVWRTFENTKGRPLAISSSHQRFDGAASKRS
ncbi:MAG: glycosyltransferase family 2 protein [Archangium sp.]